jgi:hypothetical protein
MRLRLQATGRGCPLGLGIEGPSFYTRDRANDLVAVITPGLEGLLKGDQKRLGFKRAVSARPHGPDQLDLPANALLALGHVLLGFGQVGSFGFYVQHDF